MGRPKDEIAVVQSPCRALVSSRSWSNGVSGPWPSPRRRPARKWLICGLWSSHNPSLITVFLHLLRLFPILCGGHRQLALENLALRQQRTVYKRAVTRPRQCTFLRNHMHDLVSTDFFTVPTAGWRVLFVLVVLAHDRRRVVHFNVTEHPTAAWAAQQIIEALPDDTAPTYLLHDRDTIYGHAFRQRLTGLGIREALTAARSP